MKPIRKILIANRGEIAARITRTCHAMGIDVVAIYADPDRHAPFVRTADEAVYIGPPMASASFLAIDKLIDAARRTGADAIHPGYGFLAENADFAQACADAGSIFIGPPPEAIRRMGSKIEAKKIAAAAGVPTIPGFSAEGLADAEIQKQAAAIGYPVLIKASAGGGGKGMRIVAEPGQLVASLAAARRESKSAFGDDTLLVERYISSPRHIEMQIFGDQHGALVHCFERECSIQRRYQKIIEEAPSPIVTPELRARMGAAAIAVARAIGYVNAGTVELVTDAQGNFYFLEVNTRLQVEHPVTEEITGLDLVRLQIQIAQGERLPFAQDDLRINGHAIECRIYAEDPHNDFLPSTGRVLCWETPAAPGLRYENGVETGSDVTIHYDPMLAKVIAHAPTRGEAVRRLVKALGTMRVHGVRTNIGLLVDILQHPEFGAGNIDTHFIASHLPPQKAHSDREIRADRAHAIAAALWQQARRRQRAPVLRSLPSGWRNNPSQRQQVSFRSGEETITVAYTLRGHGDAEGTIDGDAWRAAIDGADDDGIAVAIDDVRRRYRLIAEGERYHVHSPLGTSVLDEVPRFPPAQAEEAGGGCRAPMPGKILAVRVATGETVAKGQVLVILEAMKMEHEVVAPEDGRVESIAVEIGQQVEAGAVLAVLA